MLGGHLFVQTYLYSTSFIYIFIRRKEALSFVWEEDDIAPKIQGQANIFYKGNILIPDFL